ncbi:MAG: hypothetical protein DHS20C14_13260 [Phycisphaeraceae bacterium]|nr:MAG: hypothetical protein DHS20C14_13260 [Phycisphaeraceae bacterium]
MNTKTTAALLAAMISAGAGMAQTIEFDWIGDGIAGTSISGDGTVIAGNIIDDNSYETFRWVEGDATHTRLGRATVPVLGTGAGTPDVSDDGTRVSATILNTAETLATFGLWTEGSGWAIQDATPVAPDANQLDSSIASVWGLSGDGEHVTGFYWTGGKARPTTWSPSGGAVGLERRTPTSSARVNCSNYDGSVVAGWSENPGGTWQPTVWVNGAITVLDTTDGGIDEIYGVNADGTVLVGESYDLNTLTHVATVWCWDGAQWNAQKLGTLPNTAQGTGRSIATSVSADGSVIVGTNYFTFNGPFSNATGFIWTAEGGMQDIETMLADAGYSVPAGYDLFGLDDISADGTTIVGNASFIANPWIPGAFRIRLIPACFADCDGNGVLNVDDIDCFVAAFLGADLEGADCDANGVLNVDDIDCYVASFIGGCGGSTGGD